VRTYKRQADDIGRVTYADSGGRQETILATLSHRFWVEGRGWVALSDVAANDVLQAASGQMLHVSALQALRSTRTNVYNIEVKSSHTYFVGKSRVWVHNACGDTAFQVADRVAGQLEDPRLGPLAGKITPDQLQGLANNPNALKFLDTATGNTNIMQVTEGRLLRITTAADEPTKIISVGPMQRNGLFNGISNGRFEPVVE
jgi:hypothetical protein